MSTNRASNKPIESNQTNSDTTKQGSSQDKPPEGFDPSKILRFAFLFDPAFRSIIFLHSWFLYFFIKFLKARFSFYRMGKESLFIMIFKVDVENRLKVKYVFLLQLTLFMTSLFMFVGMYISRGGKLRKDIIKYTDMTGKVALVTGGYSGIGYETVLQLLKWNCRVVILGRNNKKGELAVKSLNENASFHKDNLLFIQADLDDLNSVKRAAEEFLSKYERLDILINNAGVYIKRLEKTKFNIEKNFSSNFLGHFYLTKLLLEIIKKTQGKVINVSSMAHYKYHLKYDDIFTKRTTTSMQENLVCSYYGRSKLFNIWFTHGLQRRLFKEKSGVIVVSLAPGIVQTKMVWPIKKSHYYMIPKFLVPLVLKSPFDGASTTLYLAAMPRELMIPGSYYTDCNIGIVSKTAFDEENEDKLWDFAEVLVRNLTE